MHGQELCIYTCTYHMTSRYHCTVLYGIRRFSTSNRVESGIEAKASARAACVHVLDNSTGTSTRNSYGTVPVRSHLSIAEVPTHS